MQIEAVQQRQSEAKAKPAKTYPPLEAVTSPNVETDAAAFYLNREPQTLRTWACFDSGPIKPIRIGTRLAWPVAELRRLCGLSQKE